VELTSINDLHVCHSGEIVLYIWSVRDQAFQGPWRWIGPVPLQFVIPNLQTLLEFFFLPLISLFIDGFATKYRTHYTAKYRSNSRT
jgi:hypothetical protein